MRARHRVNGSYVSADEAVLRRLGPEWEVVNDEAPAESEKKPSTRKRTTARKSDTK